MGMTAIVEALPTTTGRLIEIRLLGALEVHRPDGSAVDGREWKTGKTLDLLRMLALTVGRPTPVDDLQASLWPDSEHSRAQSSLRTATFRIRQVLGRDALEREFGGLRLHGARVDVAGFRTLANRTRHFLQAGDTTAAAMAAQEADALYRGELRAHDDGADWVVSERRSLDAIRQGLLCDGAEAVAALGLPAEAVDFARRVLAGNPYSERASRLLMAGYAGLGETSAALREYDRCRRLLADELGVDPAPQTQAVHLRILRGWQLCSP
jgi:DNA-binding SARP family transcriptional activator